MLFACKRAAVDISKPILRRKAVVRHMRLLPNEKYLQQQREPQCRSFASLYDRAMALRKKSIEREIAEKGSNGDISNNLLTNKDRAMAIFDEIDLNHDGIISRDEFLIAIEKMQHLDLMKMKKSLACNDISFNHKASVLGRTVLITNQFDAWQFIKGLPEYKHVSHLCPPVALPPITEGKDYTLVLDMDETLLHCNVDEPEYGEERPPPDHRFKVNFQGSTYEVSSWLRPYLRDFLEKTYENFEIIIFTASQPAYANEILDIIDPEKKYFHHRLFRDSCIEVDGNYVKDLNVLGRDLSKTIIVDNSPHVFGYQVDNGIPIDSWYPDNTTDTELQKLEWFLRELIDADDVRTHVREKFQVYKLIEEAASKKDPGAHISINLANGGMIASARC